MAWKELSRSVRAQDDPVAAYKPDVIRADNLSYRYERELVFEKVGFTIRPGDFAAVIGANGAGKSTLMRLLLGELQLQEGSISLFGEDVGKFRDWPRVGYVPQNGLQQYQNFPATGIEVVRANLYGQLKRFRPAGRRAKAQALAALAEVGAEDFSGKMLSELSGGQLQRIMLARVLVSDPDLLVLDEPTNGVDARTVDLLYEKLAELNRKTGRTIVMVTHDLARAASVVGRVLCLEEGSLVELDEQEIADEISHKHHHPHTAREVIL